MTFKEFYKKVISQDINRHINLKLHFGTKLYMAIIKCNYRNYSWGRNESKKFFGIK